MNCERLQRKISFPYKCRSQETHWRQDYLTLKLSADSCFLVILTIYGIFDAFLLQQKHYLWLNYGVRDFIFLIKILFSLQIFQ